MALSFFAAAAGAGENTGPDAPFSILTGSAAPAQASTAAPSGLQQPARHSQVLLSALKHLSALLSRGSRVDQQGLDGVAVEIAGLDARIKALLGPALIKEIEDEEKELQDNARIARGRSELTAARSAIVSYYGDTEGKYPATPAELITKYIPAMPELELPGHVKNSSVELTASDSPDIEKAVADTGGWLYFNEPGSRYFGMLVLNCSHTDNKGTALYKY